jgi:MscS family membrane protein
MIEQFPLVNDLPEDLRNTIIRVLLVVLALLLIWGLRRLITMILIRPLRAVTKRTGRQYDDQIIEAAIMPMRWFIIAIGILISAELLEIGGGLFTFVENIGRSLIIVAILMMIYKLIDLLMLSANILARVTGMNVEDRLLPFLRTAVKILVIALGIVITLQEWGYNVSGLVAGLGLGGLAFSLAAQDTVANLFGFTAIISDRPFDIGEFIITPDVEGIVEHVGIRSTRVRRLDQAVVYVPNNKLANSAVLNWSRLSKRRVDYILGVTYDSSSGDIRVLLHRIREMLKAQQTVDPDSVVVYFINFGDSSLEVLVRCYVFIADWGEFTAEKERLNLLVMDIVDDLGMSIAFPSMSLYVENITEFTDARSVPDKKPTLSPRERALMAGHHEKTEKPQVTDEDENITGQQDEPDER